ncbi:MAG: fumarylacetoacetate hydrolase family protein [Proteobacteria bacterium]|nr:fumarylacetoacetate hydrolase family protein [Pseudomonadota bacterium]
MQLVTFERREDRDGGGDTQGSLSEAALGFETLDWSGLRARRLGAVIPPGPRAGDIVDLNRALLVRLSFDDVGAPEAQADSLLPSDMVEFLRRGASARRAAEESFAWVLDSVERYDAPDLVRAGVALPSRSVHLCAPVPRPGKIIGVARNYASHALERGQREPPEQPVLFIKSSSSVIGPGAEIVIPRASQQVDYEAELAVVIGSRARNVAVEEALGCVAGYTAANDVTARDFQNTRGQHFIGKSCDSFAPLGPVLLTADEVSDPQDLGLRCVVSGELRQDARTKEMIFPVSELISFASKLMTLEPGDVILTGTPAGVGAASDPPRWLHDGDVVDVEIDAIGRLRNYVRQE